MDNRSPIERMIDESCGHDPFMERRKTGSTVTLKCPACKRTKSVDLEDYDPPGTKLVVTKCPNCFESGDFTEIQFFDSDGRGLPAGNHRRAEGLNNERF